MADTEPKVMEKMLRQQKIQKDKPKQQEPGKKEPNADKEVDVPVSKVLLQHFEQAEGAEKTDDKKVEQEQKKEETLVYLADNCLPMGTRIRYVSPKNGEEMTFSVIQWLNRGSYGNTYLVKDALDNILIMKELCFKDSLRRADLSLDLGDYLIDTIIKATQAFNNEPGRIIDNMQKNLPRATQVHDDMSFDEALEAARKEFAEGCIFEWQGSSYDSYTPKQKDELNIALPRTQVFQAFGNSYYLMDKAEGKSLRQILLQSANMVKDMEFTLKVMEQLADAVSNIHRLGCVHQDISPGNVMVAIVGDNVRCKVIDFGMAANVDVEKRRIVERGEYGSLFCGGTLGFGDSNTNRHRYLADIDRIYQLDIYALGAILYCMTFLDTSIGEQAMIENLIKDINLMHMPGNDDLPYSIEASETPLERQKKIKLNECYKLVKYATCPVLEKRCPDAATFKRCIKKQMTYLKWSDKDTLSFPAHESVRTLAFECSGQWSITIPPAYKWLTVGKTEGVTYGREVIELTVAENTSFKKREATVHVECGVLEIVGCIEQAPAQQKKEEVIQKDEGKKKDKIEPENVKKKQAEEQKDVHQDKAEIKMPVNFEKIEVSGGKEIVEIEFEPNMDWQTVTQPAICNWVKLDKTKGGVNDTIIKVSIDKNQSGQTRKCLLLVVCGQESIGYEIIQNKNKSWLKNKKLWGK